MSDNPSDGAIRVLCPTTGEVVSTGISVGNAATLRDTEMHGNSFECPGCGAMHTWCDAHVG